MDKTLDLMDPEFAFGHTDTVYEEHIEFVRSLKLFKDFPCEKFNMAQAQFFHKYFKPDRVVLPSSRDSDWVVVLKTGSCKVICEVQIPPQTQQEEKCKKLADLRQAFPLVSAHRHIKEQQKRSKSALALGLETGELREVMKANLLAGITNPSELVPHSMTNSGENPRRQVNRDIARAVEEYRYKIKASMAEWGGDLRDRSSTDRLRQERFVLERDRPHQEDTNRMSTEDTQTRHSSSTRVEKDKEEKEFSPVRPHRVQYVQIARRFPGQIFGLETLYQKYPMSLSLVSEGAGCIFISKKLFIKECNVEVLKFLSDLVITFPTQMYVKYKMKEQHEWKKYKQGLIRDIIRTLPYRAY